MRIPMLRLLSIWWQPMVGVLLILGSMWIHKTKNPDADDHFAMALLGAGAALARAGERSYYVDKKERAF